MGGRSFISGGVANRRVGCDDGVARGGCAGIYSSSYDGDGAANGAIVPSGGDVANDSVACEEGVAIGRGIAFGDVAIG